MKHNADSKNYIGRREFLKQTGVVGVAALVGTGCSTIPVVTKPEKIVVIGAGISGLAAAKSLAEAGHDVIVLEGQSRIGGRIHTIRSWESPIDLGATWIHGKNRNPITSLAKTNEVQFAATDWDNIIGVGKSGNPLNQEELDLAKGDLSTVYRKAYWKAAYDHIEDDINEIYLNAERRTGVQREDFTDRRDTLTNIERDRIDGLRNAWLEGNREYHEFRGGDQFMVGGFDGILNSLKSGLTIHTNQRVQKIEMQTKKVRIQTVGSQFEADRCVVTLPLGVLQSGAVEFSPGLPDSHANSIEKLKMTSMNKIFLRFDKSYWPNEIDAFVGSNGDEHSQVLFFNQHHFSKTPILMMMAPHGLGKVVEEMPDSDATQFAYEEIKSIIGGNLPKPTQHLRTRWGANPFSMGSYSYRNVGTTPQDRIALQESVDQKLYFAGEAAHDTMYGTTHGAFLSGRDVAKKILTNG
jgi:monoamine oxidase